MTGVQTCALPISISLNNGKYLFIGYKSSVQLSDITFETIGGCDVMKIHHTTKSHGKPIEFDNYLTTEFIEGIDVMDEKNPDVRLDPFTLK